MDSHVFHTQSCQLPHTTFHVVVGKRSSIYLTTSFMCTSTGGLVISGGLAKDIQLYSSYPTLRIYCISVVRTFQPEVLISRGKIYHKQKVPPHSLRTR
jgi:hypothetical protein